jgi:mediator of RNA polymerase II transcription subunit 14
LIKMNHNGLETGAGVAVNGKASGRPDIHKTSLTNGDIVIPGLGSYPTPNGVSPTSPPTSTLLDLPPELRHVTEDHNLRHITEGYQPFGTLIGRVTQECFNGLSDVVNQLAEMQVPTSSHLTNGASSHPTTNGAENNTPTNHRKKKMLLEWAHSQRQKLIKLLVLSQWSRHVDDVSKMIDLIHWSNSEVHNYHDAADSLGRIKFETHNFKVRNPDMETALAVLSTGEVPWMPEV